MPHAAVVAHGIGGRQDLPIPFNYALVGAVLAIVVSFVALVALWRTPHLKGAAGGVALPRFVRVVVDSAAFAWVLRIVGLVAIGWITVAALFGTDDALNPTAGFIYVVFWVGILVVASALFGPVWRALNPVRTLHLLGCRAARLNPSEGIFRYPERLGRWPAGLTLVAFAWLELVAPDRATLPVLRIWFGLYLVVMVFGVLAFGDEWFDRGDGFEVASTLIGRISPFGRRDDGVAVLRNPLDGLEATPMVPGTAFTLTALIGSTAFDGLSNAPVWVRLLQGGWSSPQTVGTLGLLASVAVFSLAYAGCAALASRIGGASAKSGPSQFAHSLIPIAIGYAIAHYYSLLIIVGQQTIQNLSDPLGTGADYLGTAGGGVSYALITATGVATLQVVSIVVGHVIGVFSAHERAVRLFDRRRAVMGQVPLLVLMIVFTLTGLTLLFAG